MEHHLLPAVIVVSHKTFLRVFTTNSPYATFTDGWLVMPGWHRLRQHKHVEVTLLSTWFDAERYNTSMLGCTTLNPLCHPIPMSLYFLYDKLTWQNRKLRHRINATWDRLSFFRTLLARMHHSRLDNKRTYFRTYHNLSDPPWLQHVDLRSIRETPRAHPEVLQVSWIHFS